MYLKDPTTPQVDNIEGGIQFALNFLSEVRRRLPQYPEDNNKILTQTQDKLMLALQDWLQMKELAQHCNSFYLH